MARIVMKFGGTSVADLDRIRNVARRIKHQVAQGDEVAVVVSAMAGTTNQLVGWCQQLSPLFDAREYDAVVATGEQVTAGLTAIALQDAGLDARSWMGWQIAVETDGQHGKARIDSIEGDELIERMRAGQIPVVAGFQGIGPDNRVTTLGRGGSDTSAVALAAALKADRCDIYTDVDGIYTTDPRIVAKARKLAKITYEEMLELASVGAKVLQTRSVELAMKERVRVQVLSSFTDAPGTLVVDEDEVVEQEIVAGIAYSRDEAKVTVRRVPDRPGIAAAIFVPLAEAHINVDMIVQNVAEDGTTDMTFHGRQGRAAARRAGVAGGAGRHRLCRDRHRPGCGEDLGGGGRHAQPCRRRRYDVPHAGRARHQHPGDFHQRDQGQRADRRRIYRACGARAAYGISTGCLISPATRQPITTPWRRAAARSWVRCTRSWPGR